MQPILEAGPYTLRPPEQTDIPWIFDACQDPEVGRWTEVPHPYLAEHAVAFVENGMGAVWSYVITRTETGELLGAIGVKSFDAAAGRGEVGFWLAAEARGHGVIGTALDALEAAMAAQLGVAVVVLRIAEGNERSLAVARRGGYELEGRQVGGCNGVDALVLTKRVAPAI
jgi:RimJ/RimL family protein N-acetyltransferase